MRAVALLTRSSCPPAIHAVHWSCIREPFDSDESSWPEGRCLCLVTIIVFPCVNNQYTDTRNVPPVTAISVSLFRETEGQTHDEIIHAVDPLPLAVGFFCL